MSRDRKRRKEGEGMDKNAWLQTFGDMMTLLLVFFVMLFSFSTIDHETFEEIMISIHESFSGVLEAGTTKVPPEDVKDIADDVPEDFGDDMTEEQREMMDMYQQFDDYIEEKNLDEVMSIMMDERGLMLRFQDKILFDSGKAELKPEAREILTKVAEILAQVDNEVTVEGHTDNVPQYSYRFPSNWELSTGRATSVLRYLVEENDMEPQRFFAAGYGEYRPIAPNTSPENRQLNRRVDITVLWSYYERDEYLDRGTEEDLVEAEKWKELYEEHEENFDDIDFEHDNTEDFLDEGG